MGQKSLLASMEKLDAGGGDTCGAARLPARTTQQVVAGEAPRPPEHQRQASWAPKLYAFDMEASDAKSRSLAEEAQMLRELGFDGVAYLLWYDDPDSKLRRLGENLDENLRTLDQVGLPLLGVGVIGQRRSECDPSVRSASCGRDGASSRDDP